MESNTCDCGESFSTYGGLLIHQQQTGHGDAFEEMDNPMAFNCGCGRDFPSLPSMRVHQKNGECTTYLNTQPKDLFNRAPMTVMCDGCQQGFANIIALNAHMPKCDRSNPIQVDESIVLPHGQALPRTPTPEVDVREIRIRRFDPVQPTSDQQVTGIMSPTEDCDICHSECQWSFNWGTQADSKTICIECIYKNAQSNTHKEVDELKCVVIELMAEVNRMTEKLAALVNDTNQKNTNTDAQRNTDAPRVMNRGMARPVFINSYKNDGGAVIPRPANLQDSQDELVGHGGFGC